MKRLTIASMLLALAIPAAAQERLGEKIDVSAVLLDVIVTDAKGSQILGLGKDDFIVTENGNPQKIDSVDYVTSRVLLEGREEAAPFKVERVTSQRYFVFFFDRPAAGVLTSELMSAREAVRRFIRDEMKENDLVAIAGHDNRLKIYSDFTSDPKRLEAALGDATRFGPGLRKGDTSDGLSIFANLDVDEMVNHTRTVYEGLSTLADALRPIRGRKNLVLFSAGIADIHETIRSGMVVGRSVEVDAMLESLNSANIAVYGVQLLRDVPREPMFHQRLSEISDSTGGRYFQFSTSFVNVLNQIENTNSGYYLVTYQSEHPKGEKGFQKVGVKVKNPEFRVVARSGYEFGG